jgi:ATP adenylyltransferase
MKRILDRLWAPWRLKYVQACGGDTECFLCRALREGDDRANLLLARGRACAVMLNRYPYNNGHLMAFPFRHVRDLSALDPAERSEMMDLLCEATEALKIALSPDGFNVGVNLGKSAGAGLEEHLHVHVVPRWTGDTSFMPVLGGTKVIPQSLADIWDRLHPLFNRPAAPRAAGGAA